MSVWGPTRYSATAPAVLYDLLLLPGGPRDGYLLNVEWSLVYEVFFYAAFGLFALAGGRRGVAVGTAVWLAAVVSAYLKNRWREVPMLPGWGIALLLGAMLLAASGLLRRRGAPTA